jgi:hypothetical protein
VRMIAKTVRIYSGQKQRSSQIYQLTRIQSMSRRIKSLCHNLNDADGIRRSELDHREHRSRKGRDPHYRPKRTIRSILAEKNNKCGRESFHRIKMQLL